MLLKFHKKRKNFYVFHKKNTITQTSRKICPIHRMEYFSQFDFNKHKIPTNHQQKMLVLPRHPSSPESGRSNGEQNGGFETLAPHPGEAFSPRTHSLGQLDLPHK